MYIHLYTYNNVYIIDMSPQNSSVGIEKVHRRVYVCVCISICTHILDLGLQAR